MYDYIVVWGSGTEALLPGLKIFILHTFSVARILSGGAHTAKHTNNVR